jgi:hypothetical protein
MQKNTACINVELLQITGLLLFLILSKYNKFQNYRTVVKNNIKK